MTPRNLLRAILLLSCGLVASAGAQSVPATLTYEGRLLDTSGTPVQGPQHFVFSIWPSATAFDGGALYTEADDVTVIDGLCSVTIGGTTPLDPSLFTGAPLYLQLEVNTTTLSPRQALTSVPYAFVAGTAVNVAGGTVNASQVIVDGIQVIGDGGVWMGPTTGLAGPQGPAGTPGSQGSQGVPGASLNPLQLALGRWYSASQAGLTVPTGSIPGDVKFDGTNIWVVNTASSAKSVTKISPANGTVLGTFGVPSQASGLAYDGLNVWVTMTSGSVEKLSGSTGAQLGSFPVGSGPQGACFDGTYIWVANSGPGTVSKVLASTGASGGSFPAGNSPADVLFDGTNIWVTNNTTPGFVTELNPSDGGMLGSYPVGDGPVGITFDGANIWTANTTAGTVTKLATNGTTLATLPVGQTASPSPNGVVFDGINIWVTNSGEGTVTKLLASTGALVGNYAVASPQGIAFDGANMWVTQAAGTVTKM